MNASRPEPAVTPAVSAPRGSFEPLRERVFAVLWAATVLGNIGSFMRDVASAWMVTELSASPAAVGLVQAAATLPVFLLAIPAGVLSDILDRRRFLIGIQVFLALVSLCLLVLAKSGSLSVNSLVVLTFMGGIGAALMGPTWQSIVPELVPRAELKSAVALNSLGINIARAIGPAAGGLLLASFGAALTYGVDVLSYVFVIAALLWWRRPQAGDAALPEHFLGAFRAGIRFTRASRELHVVLLRAAMFFLFSSSVWALLPLVARQMLGGSASFYGVLLGAVGAGAIAGAVAMPRLRAGLDADGLVLLASLLTAGVMAALFLAPAKWLAVVLLLVLGIGWIIALTTLNGVAQSILPNWVRGRGLAVYLTVFNGALAAGSVIWGLVAQQTGVPLALLMGAVGLVVVAALFHRIRLPAGDTDLQPSRHWPEPLLAEPVDNDRGPVMVQVEYRVRKQDRAAFWQAIQRLSLARRRDGAYAWGITEDASDPDRLLEWFLVESWAEHLRQHERVSMAQADVQYEAWRYHMGPDRPLVRHYLALEPAADAGPP
ncbi:MFS transporter [Variovorax sp. J22P168]|uniref:MFS transporter n=1 Tax=Variovorax jilinensis TaxID=3053513 RepID=UPI002578C072|nr:MFS transporter [Variovorax sp. J22P168]MDM0015865.1 MFS transporter [Variovorax sp. J22P168]